MNIILIKRHEKIIFLLRQVLCRVIFLRYTMLFMLCLVLEMGPAAFGAQPDVVRFATLNSNYRVALEAIIDEYEKKNPNIDVELTIVSRNFETWIRTRIAAGGDLVPDIYNGNYTLGYDKLGKWVELDEYLNAINPYTGRIWSDTLDISLLERYRSGGHIYQIPIDSVGIALFYNKEIFNRLGIMIPENWTELLSICETIKQAGYAPIAISGTAQNFWVGDMGWLVRILNDAYMRDWLPQFVARPGDWDYDEHRNAEYKYTGTDLYEDLMVVQSDERLIQAILEGRIDPRQPKFKKSYERLRELSTYFQDGYLGSDLMMTRQLFYRQGAAMIFFTSAMVTGLEVDLESLEPADRFEYGTFWLPPIENDPLVCGPFRGVGGAGMLLSVMRQGTNEHEKNVIDFLRYLTSSEAGEMLVRITLDEGQPIIGPLAIKDVSLPDGLDEKFEVFRGNGYDKMTMLRGVDDDNEHVHEWAVLAQEYMLGRLTLDEFSTGFADIFRRSALHLKETRGYDLDPTTRDNVTINGHPQTSLNLLNNGPLMAFILIGFLACMAMVCIWVSSGQQRFRTVTAFGLLAPGFLLLCCFNYYPAIKGLMYAFTNCTDGETFTFNGLSNFTRMLEDKTLHLGMLNMLILLAAGMFKATVIPFMAAETIIALMSDRLRYLFRTIFTIPMVVPGMVTLLVWSFIFEPNLGLLNQTLTAVGLDSFRSAWLGDPKLALSSLIFMGFPWVGGAGTIGLLVLMGGLLSIPMSLYESYQLESTSFLKRIFAIDLPMLRSQFRLLIILVFIGAVQDFQTVLILTDGGPGLSTNVPGLHMYHQAFRFSNYGYGAAIGFVLFLIILGMSVLTMKLIRKTEME